MEHEEEAEQSGDWLNEEDGDENGGEKMVVNPTYVRERIDVIQNIFIIQL